MPECGTNAHYMAVCRCAACTEAHRVRAREYRRRKQQESAPLPAETGPGPVETGVKAEIHGVADARPGLAQIALSLARLLDNPKAGWNQQPAAAKVLATLLDKLHTASAHGRRGHLALVRTMTAKG